MRCSMEEEKTNRKNHLHSYLDSLKESEESSTSFQQQLALSI